MASSQSWEHPENDLHSDADFANRYRPSPQSFDELADAPDPLAEAEANRRSTRQAIAYAIAVPVTTIVVALLLLVVTRMIGGPYCESGEAAWLCSPASRLWWPLATSLIPMGGTVGCGIILYRKYINYLRWRPWMGTFWFMVPFSMFWMVGVMPIAIVGYN